MEILCVQNGEVVGTHSWDPIVTKDTAGNDILKARGQWGYIALILPSGKDVASCRWSSSWYSREIRPDELKQLLLVGRVYSTTMKILFSLAKLHGR